VSGPTGQIEGRVAVITGAGSGIGAATAKLFAREGARVIVADIREDSAERVAAEIRSAGGEAAAVFVDVVQEATIVRMLDAAVDRYGRLDILHNNATYDGPDKMAKDQRVTDISVETWDLYFAVHTRGPFLGCKHAIPHMLRAGGGAIVNTSSVDAFMGDTMRTAYAASKAALTTLTKSVATQFGKQGVRCNAVAPGMTLTPRVKEMDPATIAKMARHFPTPRLAEPEQIASVVLFLASEAAAFVNGHTLYADGGLLSHAPWYAEFNT
jgi:NAD(P)-dependent dehydrogenase (short-subunit alcohol dehydrogenase family)